MELLDTIQIQQLPLQFKFEAQLKMDVYSGCCSKKKGGYEEQWECTSTKMPKITYRLPSRKLT